MDSFFSLFDPTDGGQNKNNTRKKHKIDSDSVKKKNELPKGRRRGRRSNGKHESLPEESSFLCEPDLSNGIVVKGVSYIENYIEINTKDDDDKRPKRRNSNRKSRRKRTKTTPIREQADAELNPCVNLNNQIVTCKKTDGSVGKNVNKLTDDKKRNNQKKYDDFDDKMCNVIDGLEGVSLKEDLYTSGEFNTGDFDEDWDEPAAEDSDSDYEDSADEVYGNLPPEPRFGNVEYKLQLVSLCEKRFQHLVTQLKWRLRSGGGRCVYVVGVRDCGAVVGLRARALRGSLRTLRRMARALAATLRVTTRRLAPDRAVAEVHILKLADPQQSMELRIAVMGANEAGKSTLIGVLTQGELDNGRGSARLNMFRHLHEVKSGRTSSLSHEILGFDAQGNVVNYGCSELMTAERIGERSTRLVSFIDLAGHSKYQRTTLHGLAGYSPHFVMLVISATAGITRITEEHIDLLLALDVPFFTVVTKCELAAAAVQDVAAKLAKLLQPYNKRPLLITDENSARNCVAPQKLILDTINDNASEDKCVMPEVAVFPVSCVRGAGLGPLHACLASLACLLATPSAAHYNTLPHDDTCEFQIDEIFHAGESSGPVVGGLLARGRIREGDDLLMGPLDDGRFVSVRVVGVHRNRAAVSAARAGHTCSLRLRAQQAPRPGMVLLRQPSDSSGLHCKSNNVGSSVEDAMTLARAQQTLSKPDADATKNTFEGATDDIQDDGTTNPRGCLYFQASIHLLRHSTAIYRGFQCTVHVGNVTQTAIIQGIMSGTGELRAGESASALFRFVRSPEYLVRGRRMLFTAGLGTRAIGRITQVFPHVP